MDYFPGDRFQGLPANHSWNAVFLKGSWQLVDAHWATRYLSSGVNMQDNVVYEYDDFYFLMEPQQVICVLCNFYGVTCLPSARTFYILEDFSIDSTDTILLSYFENFM